MQWIFLVYLAWSAVFSVITFLAYGWDKRQARRGGRRISEKRLHQLELLGGWPGALIGQKCFRHKTVKASYRWVFFGIVALHLVTLTALAYLWLR